jgi:hypothetical protein
VAFAEQKECARMYDDLAELYRPVLLQHLQQANEATQAILRRALEQALNAIESVCPAAMAMTPQGMATAYGPTDEVAGQRLSIIVATPHKYIALGAASWPRPIPPPEDCTPSHIWYILAKAVESADADAVSRAIAWRLDKNLLSDIRAAARSHRKRGYVPLWLLLCAREDHPDSTFRACGFATLLPLPSSISAQLGQSAGVALPHLSR